MVALMLLVALMPLLSMVALVVLLTLVALVVLVASLSTQQARRMGLHHRCSSAALVFLACH